MDKKTRNIKTVKKNFNSQEEANDYIDVHLKDSEDVWIEEKVDTESIDLKTQIGSWLWLYSNKKKEFYPYGMLMDVTSQFVKIKTKEEMKNENDYTDMRVVRIKNMIEAKKIQISSDGHFVNLKEYM